MIKIISCPDRYEAYDVNELLHKAHLLKNKLYEHYIGIIYEYEESEEEDADLG